MRSKMGWVVTLGLVVALCATSNLSANLLTNGSFETAAPGGWTGPWHQDDTSYVPSPLNMDGAHRAGYSNCSAVATSNTQAVVQSGSCTLTGYLAGGDAGGFNYFVKLWDGTITGTLVGQLQLSGVHNWTPVNISGAATSGTVTVEFGSTGSGAWGPVAYHVDALNLTVAQPTCTGDPTITGANPAFAANNATVNGVQINGTNFDGTCQVILRRAGYADVQAQGESANVSGTIITCNLPLNGVAMGKWNLVVTKDLCNEVEMANAFIVAVPALTNGSFENPAAPASCPTPTQASAPDNWLQDGVSTGSNHLVRDSNQYIPSCPRPDGSHYGSILVPSGTSWSSWRAFQYVTVTPGQKITLSGKFAGGALNNVVIDLREGDENGTSLGSQVVRTHTRGCLSPAVGMGYDWRFGAVSGTPVGGLVTVCWHMDEADPQGSPHELHVSHADNLVLAAGSPPAEICNDGIDNDGDGRVNCQDPDCAAFPGCTPAPVEICNDGIDNDGNGLIDCEDPACNCFEICDNHLDDNQDCRVDENDAAPNACKVCGTDVPCSDPRCVGIGTCTSTEICDNGIDDNGNGAIDCNDPMCSGDPACVCHSPFADADGDGDVDQEDFAILQGCITGSLTGPNPANGVYHGPCWCFDRPEGVPAAKDGDVDQVDVQAFEACASGPNVAANPACAP